LHFTFVTIVLNLLVSPLSLDKVRHIVDQCITTYLLDRLGSDGDTTRSYDRPLYPERKASYDLSDGLSTSHTKLSQVLSAPIQFRKEAIEVPGEQSSSRPIVHWPHDFNGAGSIVYSTSSPGSLFASHMEKRDKNLLDSPKINAEVTPQMANLNNHLSKGKEKEVVIPSNHADATKALFMPLRDHIVSSFGSFECINASFSTAQPPKITLQSVTERGRTVYHSPKSERGERRAQTEHIMSEMDAKTLLLEDFAENGSWWTGGHDYLKNEEFSKPNRSIEATNFEAVTLKSPHIDWPKVNEWYSLVLNAGHSWRKTFEDLETSDSATFLLNPPNDEILVDIDNQIMEAQSYIQRVLLKAIESLLKRPGRPLKEPRDLRFLLIILANPLLYQSQSGFNVRPSSPSRSKSRERNPSRGRFGRPAKGRQFRTHVSPHTNIGSSGQHSGIIKRILGLLSNAPNICHHHLVAWFARYSDDQFQRATDLVGSFVTYRLTRQHGKKREVNQDPTAGLVPNLKESGHNTPAALRAALGTPGQSAKKTDGKSSPVIYNDDWQIKAAARVMALLFAANNSGLASREEARPVPAPRQGGAHSAGFAARERAHTHGQIIPTSNFYNTLLDYSDLIADYEAWEARRGKFAFCQYPFFLSIWAKIQIMEHDARRQMEIKAREAFFDSILTHKTVNQYLVLKIRRDCLVEDSLKGVSEVVGSGSEEIKKGLRIEFRGEEGIDAGGIRKEWFLLLVRDVFNPDHGTAPK
jgi:E3 ubiquitin-protein ligase HECTD2